MSYHAIPLADKGFVPTDAIRNPVRWYVEEDGARLIGPFRDMAAADEYAAILNLCDEPETT